MALSLQELEVKKASLQKQLEKVELAIAQAGFVGSLVAGAYVYGKFNDGTEFSHARLLGKQEATGTSGEWYKLRLNENTPEEAVKSVRLSNIDGVEADEAPAPDEKSKGKKDPASEI